MNNEINIISKVLISSTVTVSFLFSSVYFSASAQSEENDSAVNKKEYRDKYMQQDEKEALIENLKKHKVKPDKISFIDKNWNKLSKNEIYEYMVGENNKKEISNKVQTGDNQTNSQKTSDFSSSKNRIVTYRSTSVVKNHKKSIT
ncbi:hypothetical protein O0G47_08335 [Staphylococcus pseudintermedius]|nr:hypothetical protein [Staphylococcus pseudintermedius]